MLQDIKPHLLDNQFRELKPTADDYFFSFKANKILLTIGEHNAVTLPFLVIYMLHRKKWKDLQNICFLLITGIFS